MRTLFLGGEREVVAQFQPRSRGFPVGLLDQPLYGWARHSN